MIFKRLVLTFAVMALPGSAMAYSGSPEDQMACTGDVMRLCAALTSMPNETAIVACLQKNKRNLSPECHQVIYPPAHPVTHDDDDDND